MDCIKADISIEADIKTLTQTQTNKLNDTETNSWTRNVKNLK